MTDQEPMSSIEINELIETRKKGLFLPNEVRTELIDRLLATVQTRPSEDRLLDRLAREVHAKAYADSPHVFYAGSGIHGEARYEQHPFETCPAPDCIAARAALAASRPAPDTRTEALEEARDLLARWLQHEVGDFDVRRITGEEVALALDHADAALSPK